MTTKRKKTMTKKQLEANRANAKKSTGPRTPEGKIRSALNATTHGLTAQALILENDENERLEDYIKLHAELEIDIEPHGRLEQLLVQRIAVATWRLNRAYRFEARSVQSARAAALDPPRDDDRSDRPAAPKASTRKSETGNSNSQSAIRNSQCSIVLPDRPDLDKLLRYEALIDRELNRTLTQLTRLQTLRRQRARDDEDVEDDDGSGLDFLSSMAELSNLQTRLTSGAAPQVPPAQVPPAPSPAQVPPVPSPAQVPPVPSPAQVPPVPSPAQVPPVPSPAQVPPVPSPADHAQILTCTTPADPAVPAPAQGRSSEIQLGIQNPQSAIRNPRCLPPISQISNFKSQIAVPPPAPRPGAPATSSVKPNPSNQHQHDDESPKPPAPIRHWKPPTG